MARLDEIETEGAPSRARAEKHNKTLEEGRVVWRPRQYIGNLPLRVRVGLSMSGQSFRDTNNRTGRQIDGALTIDLEDWRCALDPDPASDLRQRPVPNAEYIRESTRMILSELDREEAKATFFVLGEVALAVPEVVKEVARKGHEIASHSPIHVPPRMIPRDELERLIQRDVALLENLSGKRPIGFRVPYFSVRRDDGWLFSILSSLGFRYDSSIAPTWTPYWGIPASPKSAYFPDFSDLSKSVSQGPLLELPLTVWPHLGHIPGLPIAGGFYMRIWPTRLLSYMYGRSVRAGYPLVLYIHPGNLESNKESVSNPGFRDRISQYAGAARGLPSFRSVLKEFRLSSLATTFSSQLSAMD